MRKRFAVLLTVILALVSFESIATAAVRPGAKCSKQGQMSTTAGKKYTCVKSGSKLIWNKGISVKAAAKPDLIPILKPTEPTQTPTPVATASPSPTPAVTPKAPTTFDDLIENYDGIAYAAWSKSREKILRSSRAEISLKVILGPTTELVFKEPMVPIDLVSRMYAGSVQAQEISYLAYNYEDRYWAIDQMESILPNSGSQWVTDVACRTKETCWGGGAFYNGSNKFLFVIAVGIKDTNHLSGMLDAHEFTHIVQQMNIKKGRPPQEYLYDPWPPTWYWEGQAHFSQKAAVYFESFSDYMMERKYSSQELFNKEIFNSAHIQNFFVFNAPTDWQKNYDRWRQYDLGAMFVEILIALKGPDAAIEMWRICGTGVKFEDAFEQVYGTPFAKALPIMSKAIALQLGRN